MPKKKPVKVYLSTPETELADRIGRLLGEDRSSVLRVAFLSYAKDIGALEERLLRSTGDTSKWVANTV